MRYRLHRSRAFCLGLPGLVFLVWGWWHSMGHYAFADVARKDHSATVCHMAGEVVLMIFKWPSSEPWSFQIQHEAKSKEELLVMKAGLRMSRGPDLHIPFIPYLYIILTYLAVWGGVLVWRVRRFRKAAGLSAGFHSEP